MAKRGEDKVFKTITDKGTGAQAIVYMSASTGEFYCRKPGIGLDISGPIAADVCKQVAEFLTTVDSPTWEPVIEIEFNTSDQSIGYLRREDSGAAIQIRVRRYWIARRSNGKSTLVCDTWEDSYTAHRLNEETEQTETYEALVDRLGKSREYTWDTPDRKPVDLPWAKDTRTASYDRRGLVLLPYTAQAWHNINVFAGDIKALHASMIDLVSGPQGWRKLSDSTFYPDHAPED